MNPLIAALLLVLVPSALAAPTVNLNSPISGTHKFYHEAHIFVAQPISASFEQVELRTPRDVNTETLDKVLSPGDPFSIALNSIMLPVEDFRRGDVAVIANITSGSSEGEPVVVFFQESSYPGQILNVRDLVIHSDQSLTPGTAPYLRIRVLRVGGGLSGELAAKLKVMEGLAGRLSGLMVHPAIPIVALGVETAEALLNSGKAETIIDFTFQLYPKDVVRKSGNAVAGLIPTKWYVLGMTGNRAPYPLRLNAAEPHWFYSTNTSSQELQFPYVELTLLQNGPSVSPAVLSNSKKLVDLLRNPNGFKNDTEVERTVKGLYSTTKSMLLQREIAQSHGAAGKTAAIRKMGDTLADYYERVSSGKEPSLNQEEIGPIIERLAEYIPQGRRPGLLDSGTNFVEWWSKQGNRNGDATEIKDGDDVNFEWKTSSLIINTVNKHLHSDGPPTDVFSELNALIDARTSGNGPDKDEWNALSEFCKQSLGMTVVPASLADLKSEFKKVKNRSFVASSTNGPAAIRKSNFEEQLTSLGLVVLASDSAVAMGGIKSLSKLLNESLKEDRKRINDSNSGKLILMACEAGIKKLWPKTDFSLSDEDAPIKLSKLIEQSAQKQSDQSESNPSE